MKNEINISKCSKQKIGRFYALLVHKTLLSVIPPVWCGRVYSDNRSQTQHTHTIMLVIDLSALFLCSLSQYYAAPTGLGEYNDQLIRSLSDNIISSSISG